MSDPAAHRVPWWPWVLLAAVVTATLTLGALRPRPPATDSERVAAIGSTIKCPKCFGESVEMSNAEISREIRIDIAKRVTAGQSDTQIQDYYRGTYGDWILLTPSGSGVGGLVWVLPVVALVCAVAGLTSVFLRWRREALAAPATTDADRALVADALAGAATSHAKAANGASDASDASDAKDASDETDAARGAAAGDGAGDGDGAAAAAGDGAGAAAGDGAAIARPAR